MAEYLKFTDFRLFKIITSTTTGIQPLSIVVKAPSNSIQDTTLAPKKRIRDAVGTITLNFLARVGLNFQLCYTNELFLVSTISELFCD